ncbi:MAG: hypothetical protein LBR40_05590, partial [Bacilli bacterium]|nr:hypothetical protein [Bacilli bacterium]
MNKRFKSRLNNFIAMFIVFVMVLSTTIVYSATTLNAAENEGEITYTGGLNNGPDIDPFSGEQNSISGSKEATNLTNDESEITISFPAADYKQEYDIVLVVDGSSSFVPLAEHVDDLLNDIGTNLASRENVKINVGVVSYGTIAYENFTPGSGFYWNFFQSCVRTGSCSLASSLLPAEYRDMINYLQPVANFPDTMGTNHYESYRYLLGDATTLKELSSSQDETNPTSVAALYDEVMTNGSDYTVTALLAYAKLTNNSLATQLGYNMDNVVVGTNMEAGLEAGKDMLANGSAPDANKYMVVIGDGGSYLWNADGSDNANNEQTTKDSLQNAIYSRIAYLGQGGLNDFDNKTNPEYYNYSDFEDFLDNSDALTYNSAALSVSQWQAYLADNTINYSTILPNSLNNSTNGIDYKYTSLENGTAHAAEVVKEFANNNEGRLIFLGSLYNPTLHYPGELAYDVTAGFRDYVGSLSDSYYQINDATESDDIVNAFDGIVN